MKQKSLPTIPGAWEEQYLAFRNSAWAGWINRDYAADQSFLNNWDPLELFAENNVVKWYKNKRNRLAEVIWPVSRQGTGEAKNSIILKSYEPSSMFNALRLKWGKPKAIRHWNNVWLLNRKAIKTPQPVFIALPVTSSDKRAVLGVETMFSHYRLGEFFGRNGEDLAERTSTPAMAIPQQTLANICGLYLRELHDKEIVHRDFSGGNVLVPESWSGAENNLSELFVLLDINRVRNVETGSMDINLRIQDLERLNIPEPFLETYFMAYAAGDQAITSEFPRFLKYRSAYRRIRENKSPVQRAILKIFTYWPRTG